MKSEGEYANVFSQNLFSDKRVSSFYIEIKKEVAPHFHKKHSEHVYVISGSGIMKLADEVLYIQSGDLIFIPPHTVHSVVVNSDNPLRVLSIQAPFFNGKDRVLVK